MGNKKGKLSSTSTISFAPTPPLRNQISAEASTVTLNSLWEILNTNTKQEQFLLHHTIMVTPIWIQCTEDKQDNHNLQSNIDPPPDIHQQ